MSLPRTIHDLPTPALLVEHARLEENLRAMADLARDAGVALRPHIKTHKCPEIARLQASLGARGLACAKVSEAAVFAGAGFADIVVAYPLVGPKARALRDLADRTGARLEAMADSEEGVRDLAGAWAGAPTPLPVHLKVDTGLGRVGVPWDDLEAALRVARAIEASPSLLLAGLLTHAGHAYAADSPEEVARIGREEGERIVTLAEGLRSRGTGVPSVSVGSTPTVPHSARVPGVTEIRPGVYVFCDGNQVALGVAPVARCALTVLATVVSRPAPDRAVSDAGSKVFSTDRGAHGAARADYGIVLRADGTPDPGLRLDRLSEEHGWLAPGPAHPVRIGDRLRIVPAHACAAVNLADSLWLVEGVRVVERWPVAARGCVT